MKKSARTAPSAKTLRQLYILSGNQCANPRCATVLINANGTLVADVCHIKAEKPGGARFDKALTPEQRRAPQNLILLCSTCHKLVDREPGKYTVAVLTKWKKDREARFEAIGDTLRQRYVRDIVDEAEAGDLTLPRSLKKYIRFLKKERFAHMPDEHTIEYLPAIVLPFISIAMCIGGPSLECPFARWTTNAIIPLLRVFRPKPGTTIIARFLLVRHRDALWH
jgi:hypothetical protein